MTELEQVAESAARRIVAALDALPRHVAAALCWELLTDDSPTLSGIADAMREENRVEVMARGLAAEVFLGDVEGLDERLSDTEPWLTIGRATAEVAAAWRRAKPGIRIVREIEEAGRARGLR